MADNSVTGIKEAKAKFEKFDRAIQKRVVVDAFAAVGKTTKTALRSAVPVLTGALMRSLGIVRKAKKGRVSVIIGVRNRYQDKKTGKIPNKYAPRVELGDGDSQPQSFVRVVAQREEHSIIRRIQEGVRDAVRDVKL